MSEFRRVHHQLIQRALAHFSVPFLARNRVLFGGGTRISMDLDEFRESVDIDLLCPDKTAYRAVRETVTNRQLGDLVVEEFEYVRDIRFDRYGVRTFIRCGDTPIKLEIINCDDYALTAGSLASVPVPVLSRESCLMTKLLANADRGLSPPFKDIIDLLAMIRAWGPVPSQSWYHAEEIYGAVVRRSFKSSLHYVVDHADEVKKEALGMGIVPDFADDLIESARKLAASTT
ncbi:MAG: nucleotidyl transferase AbiEii/AbiGii toxin family protein [Natronospirillum sp.]